MPPPIARSKEQQGCKKAAAAAAGRPITVTTQGVFGMRPCSDIVGMFCLQEPFDVGLSLSEVSRRLETLNARHSCESKAWPKSARATLHIPEFLT